MLETDAAFFAAQLVAMNNATDNASKLIDELTIADEQRPPSRDHQRTSRNRRRRRSAGRLSDSRIDVCNRQLLPMPPESRSSARERRRRRVHARDAAEHQRRADASRVNEDAQRAQRRRAHGRRHRARRYGDAGARSHRSKCRTSSATTKCAAWRWARPTAWCAARRCTHTGGPITVPVGEGTLGRIFNVLGKTIDSDAPVKAAAYWPIHRPPPEFEVAGSDADDLRDRASKSST